MCGYDDNAVQAAWRGDIIDAPDVTLEARGRLSGVTSIGGNDIGTAEELLAVLPLPSRPEARRPELFDLFTTPSELPGLELETVKR